MKKTLITTVLAGALTATSAFALQVDVNRSGDYSGSEPGYYDGGEFTITSTTPDPQFNSILNNYASVAVVNGGFETFCIDTQVELQGNPQNATLDVNGVSAGTAWLYSQFAHGSLAGYDYTPGAGRATSALDLQMAIWELQGFSAGVDTAAGATFFNMALSQFGGSLSDALAADGGSQGVDALRLSYTTAGATTVSQPMLALVPDGGSTMILLGMALSGFGIILRRKSPKA